MAEIDKTKNPDTPSVLNTIVSIGQAVIGKAGEFITGQIFYVDGGWTAW